MSELWQERLTNADFVGHADTAMESIAVIEAANAEEEALAIAVALREAVEVPGKTAALVTPDRALARRVLAALARWNVPVDDSGGDALSDTPAGVFARLAAEAALDGLPPVTLLALLKHPLCRLDAARGLDAGAGDPARPAAETRHGRARSRAANLPRRAREIQPQRTVVAAPFRSAHGDHRFRIQCGRRSGGGAQGRAGAAGVAAARVHTPLLKSPRAMPK